MAFDNSINDYFIGNQKSILRFEDWLHIKSGYSSAEICHIIVNTGGMREYRKIMLSYEKQYREYRLEQENPFLTEAEPSGKENNYE